MIIVKLATHPLDILSSTTNGRRKALKAYCQSRQAELEGNEKGKKLN